MILSGLALRSNHVKMTQLKEAVIESDNNEDLEALEASLLKLRKFVDNHAVPNFREDPQSGRLLINWGTGVFYLERSFEVASEKALVEATNNFDHQINQNIHAMARDICDRQFATFSQAYVNCFIAELDKYLPADSTVPEIAMPDPSLFHLSYASPILALDLATLFMTITIVAYVVFLATLCASVISKIIRKKRKKT